DPEKSYGDKKSPNMLIKGDNLLALKALEQGYAGKVKCVFIDPPYNTGSAFEHYDDGIEHSLWLNLMRDRLIIIKNLLSQDGSLWVTLDDNESHYFKVMADEVFGRSNFVSNVIWQKKYNIANDSLWLSDSHDNLLVYAKNKVTWRPNKLERTEDSNKGYKNPDNDPRGPWMSDNYTCNKNADERPNLYYPIVNPNTGEEIWPKKTAVWRYNKETHEKNIAEDLIYWGVNGKNSTPRFKRFLSNLRSEGRVCDTLWLYQDVGHTQDAKKEQLALNKHNPFSTPKPEKLLQRILHLATNPGDVVLDSFLGSGTTAAVAHKMGRRWIGVELGEHCDTHCLPRFQKVVDGQDLGGITEATGWQRGGGFKYYSLAPSLLKEDKYGNWIIDPRYNANMLAAAMAKHENFRYSPDEIIFWKQGQSTEKDFIFTTTNFLTVEFLDRIHDEMQKDESLLICCKSFQDACLDRHSNITVKKIPQMLLGRCEFGREDYSLHIITMPSADDSPDEPALPAKPKPKRRAKANQQGSFLDDLVGEDA
ncbi:site-specific DNA-methyltransferase, partial [bacterium (Candidatus Blackallbacteria) CG17_big_fil_post_rev_8_21_14_2_50_48_46]